MLKRKEDTHIFILLTIILVVIAILLYLSTLNRITNRTIPTPTGVAEMQPNKGYTSDQLHFSITVPRDYDVTEEVSTLVISNNSSSIKVERIATNFTDVMDYINDFDTKRDISLIKQDKVQVDGYKALVRIEKFNGGPVKEEYIYTFIINGWAYSISTSSQKSYVDLDQIAKSFRYIP